MKSLVATTAVLFLVAQMFGTALAHEETIPLACGTNDNTPALVFVIYFSVMFVVLAITGAYTAVLSSRK